MHEVVDSILGIDERTHIRKADGLYHQWRPIGKEANC